MKQKDKITNDVFDYVDNGGHYFIGDNESAHYTCKFCGLRTSRLILINGISKIFEWDGSRFPKDWKCTRKG